MDLRAIGAGVLWVLGFGGVLAAFGYASWWAGFHRVGLLLALQQPAFAAVVGGSLGFACVGFAIASREGWEAIIWLVLAVSFAVLGGRSGWQAWQTPDPSASVETPGSGDEM